MRQLVTASSLAIVGLLVAGSLAYAGESDEVDEAHALQGAKVSLSMAITTAERQTGGQAFDAGVDVQGGQTHIVVETNGPGGVQTVTIDPQTGGILGTRTGGVVD